MTSRQVRVVYTKFDGSLHWHYTMRYLGSDEHGTWLGAPPRLECRRGEEPPRILPYACAQLIPGDGSWWTAVFNAEPAETEVYCDIATPPTWTDEHNVTMIDLDLDVQRYRAGRLVALVDVDEFAVHQVRYGYPSEVISRATDAAAWLQDAVGGGAEPFATAYRSWLEKVS